MWPVFLRSKFEMGAAVFMVRFSNWQAVSGRGQWN